MTLATILDSLAAKTRASEYDDIDATISIARPRLFSFMYNYYNPDKKIEFEVKFLKNFYFNEIGFETYGRFKLQLESLLLRIMPYYNYLYSASQNYDLFNDVNIVHNIIDNSNKDLQYTHSDDTTIDTTNNTTNNNNTSQNETLKTAEDKKSNTASTASDETQSNSDTLEKFLEYPQSKLDDFQNNSYLTNLKNDTNETTSHSSAQSDSNTAESNLQNTKRKLESSSLADIKNLVKSINTNSHVKHEFTVDTYTRDLKIKGKNGGKSYIELLFEYNQLISNLDAQILNECSVLFMGVGFYE